MKYHVTIKRTQSEYTSLPIEADNEKQAKRKAVKQVKKWVEDGDDIFCDNDEARYSVSRIMPEKAALELLQRLTKKENP